MVAAQRKRRARFRWIVIVLLLCDGKVIEVFGIGATFEVSENWYDEVAT